MDIKKILFKTNEFDVEKSLPDAVIFTNKDGKILWVSDKSVEIFDTSKMHLLTSNIADFIENAHNLITNAVFTGEQVITKIISKEIYFTMTAKEVKEGYVMSFRDSMSNSFHTSQTKSIDYDEINLSKNAFLIKLSNDFKSPLQSIVGFSQAMSDGLGGSMTEQQDKYIKIIKKNSSELMYFINKFLEMTQTEIETKSPELKMFDIINTVNTAVKFNEQLYKNKELKWCVNISEDIKNTVISDEELLKNIIQNIIEVIVKSVDMGDITLSLSIPDEELVKSKNLFGSNFVMLSISSSSLLLSENDLEYIFDPYKIVDTSNRKNLLRAIILSCVKNVIKTLNGVVWVESKILKNTSFNIIIPEGKNELQR